MNSASREKEHDDVYGKSFALYNKDEMAQFTDYFRQRFYANNLDSRAIFSGKRCLDAGCGGGRGTLFMLMNGAAHVTAVDVSATNIESTARNCKEFSFDSVTCVESSLENLAFDDGQFDFVWCNGVIMHTANPDASLAEISRVLRIGGQAWIYVYGAGGLYWYLINEFRNILDNLATPRALAIMQLMRLSVRYIGEYMDDWKVPYLRAYSSAEFSARLHDFGFSNPAPLLRGVEYDTSERRTLYPQDIPWLGDGDLRYLITKERTDCHDGAKLGESPLSNPDYYASEVAECFGPLVSELKLLVTENNVLAVVVCANLQRELRDTMSRKGTLDVAGFKARFSEVLQQLRAAMS